VKKLIYINSLVIFSLCILIGWHGGLIYCFSPGQLIKLENRVTGCKCPSSCKQSRVNFAPAKLQGRLPLFLASRFSLTPNFFQIFLENEPFSFVSPLIRHPLSSVKLLF